MNKHYIRLDVNNNIIKGFSDAFETPLETDICICEDGGRQFELGGFVNPCLCDDCACYMYKRVDNSLYAKTAEELQAEHDLLPPAPLTVLEQMNLDIQTNYEMNLEALGVW